MSRLIGFSYQPFRGYFISSCPGRSRSFRTASISASVSSAPPLGLVREGFAPVSSPALLELRPCFLGAVLTLLESIKSMSAKNFGEIRLTLWDTANQQAVQVSYAPTQVAPWQHLPIERSCEEVRPCLLISSHQQASLLSRQARKILLYNDRLSPLICRRSIEQPSIRWRIQNNHDLQRCGTTAMVRKGAIGMIDEIAPIRHHTAPKCHYTDLEDRAGPSRKVASKTHHSTTPYSSKVSPYEP